MEKDFSKQFDSCPVCGGTNRFCEQLGKESKENNRARKEWNFAYDARQGVAVDPVKAAGIPIGMELPGFYIQTDVCMDCGCVYATVLKRLSARQEVKEMPQQMNREQRRRMMRGN